MCIVISASGQSAPKIHLNQSKGIECGFHCRDAFLHNKEEQWAFLFKLLFPGTGPWMDWVRIMMLVSEAGEKSGAALPDTWCLPSTKAKGWSQHVAVTLQNK